MHSIAKNGHYFRKFSLKWLKLKAIMRRNQHLVLNIIMSFEYTNCHLQNSINKIYW